MRLATRRRGAAGARALLAGLLGLTGNAPVCAAEAFFSGLGDLPGGRAHSEASGVSDDGRVVCGHAEIDEHGRTEAFV
jgi:hypothetical protein